jgi:hypothetical protein
MPLEYEYLHQMLLNMDHKISSCHCRHNSIIESVNWGTSCPWDGSFLIPKWQDKQTINTSASLLFTMGIAFYYEMLHRMLNMGSCKFPPWMMHGLISGLGVSLTIYTNSMNSQCFHFLFTNDRHPQQKNMISNKCNVESVPYDIIDEITPNSDFVKLTTS